jgi:hypothetical protein
MICSESCVWGARKAKDAGRAEPLQVGEPPQYLNKLPVTKRTQVVEVPSLLKDYYMGRRTSEQSWTVYKYTYDVRRICLSFGDRGGEKVG